METAAGARVSRAVSTANLPTTVNKAAAIDVIHAACARPNRACAKYLLIVAAHFLVHCSLDVSCSPILFVFSVALFVQLLSAEVVRQIGAEGHVE